MGGDDGYDGMFRKVLGDDAMDEIHREAVEQVRRDGKWAALAAVPVAAAFAALLLPDDPQLSLTYFAACLAFLWLMTRMGLP